MSVLNLDKTEEVEANCFLCRHTNYNYLLQMQDQLSDSSGNKSMYNIMYEAFKRRTNQPVDKEHKEIGFAQFQTHFEKHLLSLRACITRDIREVKKMQARLLKDIYEKEDVKASAINSWMRLSQHKISIANKLKAIPKQVVESVQPYQFDWSIKGGNIIV